MKQDKSKQIIEQSQQLVNKQIDQVNQQNNSVQNKQKQKLLQIQEQSKPISQYFTKVQCRANTLSTVNNYYKQVLTNIVQSISYGTLQINEFSKSFHKQKLSKTQSKHNKKINVDFQSQYKQHMKMLQKQKSQTINKLHKIYQDQKKLLNLKNYHNQNNNRYSNQILIDQSQNSNNLNYSQRKLNKMQRSFITAEEKIKIKSLVKAKNQFEQQLQKRVNKILEKVKQKQIILEKQKEQQRQEKVKKRKSQIIQQHKQYQFIIKKVQKQKANKYQNSQRKVNYFYLQKQKEDQQKTAQRLKYNQMLSNQKRQKMKTDYQQIKNHALQHDQYIQRKRIQSEQTIMQKNKINPVKYYQTQFLKRIKVQQNQKRIEDDNKIRMKKSYNHKIKQFRDYVRSNFSPSINNKSRFIPKKASKAAKNLTIAQRYEIGNKYLQVARKLKKISPQTTAKQPSTQHDFINPQNKSNKYPNYLINLHEQRTNKQKNKIKTQYSNAQEQLKRLLSIRDRDLNDFQIKKAYKLTRQVQNQSYVFHKSKSKQFDLMKDKLRLLQVIIKK